jgi:hypothetical protein
MTRGLLVGLLLAAVICTRDATADAPPLAKLGATPSFVRLPEGHVAAMPEGAPPSTIGAHEKLPGFVVVPPPLAQRKYLARAEKDAGLAFVFADREHAKRFLASRAVEDDGADTCFVEGERTRAAPRKQSDGEDADDAMAPANSDWPAQGSSQLSLQFRRSEPAGAVRAVHAERLVTEGAGLAILQATDAWVDPRTHGVRLIARSRVPLARVFVGPNGLEVYAARDGGGVQVVVRASLHPVDDAAVSEALRPLLRNLAMVLPDGSAITSDCGHLRLALHPSPEAAQMASLQSNAFLPPLDEDEPDGPAQAFESRESRASRKVQAMRRRPFQLSVSASESSVDAHPVFSVTVGWIGRERPGDS